MFRKCLLSSRSRVRVAVGGADDAGRCRYSKLELFDLGTARRQSLTLIHHLADGQAGARSPGRTAIQAGAAEPVRHRGAKRGANGIRLSRFIIAAFLTRLRSATRPSPRVPPSRTCRRTCRSGTRVRPVGRASRSWRQDASAAESAPARGRHAVCYPVVARRREVEGGTSAARTGCPPAMFSRRPPGRLRSAWPS